MGIYDTSAKIIGHYSCILFSVIRMAKIGQEVENSEGSLNLKLHTQTSGIPRSGETEYRK